MILLQILFGIIAFALTPVIILLFFIQSRNPVYNAINIGILILYSFSLMLSYANPIMGIITFAALFVLQQLVHQKRFENIEKNSETRYLYGIIETKNHKLILDFIVSLVPLYLVIHLPFPFIIKPHKSNNSYNVKKIAEMFLKHGKDTSIDIDTPEAIIKFKVA